MTRRIQQILVFFLAIPIHGAIAQPGAPDVAKRFEPFHLPGSIRTCRPKPVPQSSPAEWVALEFEDERSMVEERLIDVLYDSLGSPQLMVVAVTENRGNSDTVFRAFIVSFSDDGPGTGFQTVDGGVDDPTPGPPRDPLPQSMVLDARNLMIWLWNHRCKEDSPAC